MYMGYKKYSMIVKQKDSNLPILLDQKIGVGVNEVVFSA